MFGDLYIDLPEFDEVFMDGFGCLENEDFNDALGYFLQGHKSVGRQSNNHAKYLSFVGLCQVLLGDCSGLNTCRQIAESECFDGDIFCNLAIAEYRMKHRGQAFRALRKGMATHKGHTGLGKLFDIMDTRNSPPISFLSRECSINIVLGKIGSKLNSSTKKINEKKNNLRCFR